jgi:hypothetical protein
MKTEQIEEYMALMPSGIPYNDDTYMKLLSWIKRNQDVAETWKTTPPTIEQEEKIYNIFGCHSPVTNGYVSI